MYISFETNNSLAEVLQALNGIELRDVNIKVNTLHDTGFNNSADTVANNDVVLDVPACMRLIKRSYSTVYKILNLPGCPTFYKDKNPSVRSKKYIKKSDFIYYADIYNKSIKFNGQLKEV